MKARILYAAAVACLVVAPGCAMKHTPHIYNPLHWVEHGSKIFDPTDGELHTFHVDLDRVVFGVENYEELETTEYMYSE